MQGNVFSQIIGASSSDFIGISRVVDAVHYVTVDGLEPISERSVFGVLVNANLDTCRGKVNFVAYVVVYCGMFIHRWVIKVSRSRQRLESEEGGASFAVVLDLFVSFDRGAVSIEVIKVCRICQRLIGQTVFYAVDDSFHFIVAEINDGITISARN